MYGQKKKRAWDWKSVWLLDLPVIATLLTNLSTIQIWSLTPRLLIHKPWGRTKLFDSHLTLRSISWQRLCKLIFSIKIVDMIVACHPWTWPTDSVVLGFILVDWMQAAQFWHQGFIYIKFYWSIDALGCCVSFCYETNRVSFFLDFFPI